jgi:hypothetical protein
LSAIARFDIPVAGGALALFRLGTGPGTAEPVIAVHGINYYTLVMGRSGARAVAQAIVRALQTPAGDPALRSAR